MTDTSLDHVTVVPNIETYIQLYRSTFSYIGTEDRLGNDRLSGEGLPNRELRGSASFKSTATNAGLESADKTHTLSRKKMNGKVSAVKLVARAPRKRSVAVMLGRLFVVPAVLAI